MLEGGATSVCELDADSVCVLQIYVTVADERRDMLVKRQAKRA